MVDLLSVKVDRIMLKVRIVGGICWGGVPRSDSSGVYDLFCDL
jgi:hypothetical protein